MKLLILGGTVFVGRAVAREALARGHSVTLFHRGRRNPGLFPEAETILGDRDGGLDALDGRTWDAVLDTCGYVPRVVRASARRLAPSVGHYTFISSISVYRDWNTPGMAEDAPVGTLEDATVEQVTGETYGPLKALCEEAAEAELPGRTLVVRPGLIVGPHDPTNRFTYWPCRVARGGEVLAPGQPGLPVQFIDVRDLAEWTLSQIERGRAGTFNATGPGERLTMGALLETCREVSASDARFTWIPDAFLLEAGVKPYTELPLWIPETEDSRGHSTVNVGKAEAAGLRFRPLAETVRDTLEWAQSQPLDSLGPNGLAPEREAELLARFRC